MTAAAIYIVRHGQDEDNAEELLNGHRDRPLTELGRQQAAKIAERISKLDVDAVVCSPLQRARYTAEAIHKACGLEDEHFAVHEGLKERDFGVLTGMPLKAIKEVAGDSVLETERVTYFLEVEGAETFPDLLARGRSVLDHIHARYASKRVVLVGHGDINKMVRASYLDWSWEEGLKTAYVGNTDVIKLPPDSDQHTHGVMQFED